MVGLLGLDLSMIAPDAVDWLATDDLAQQYLGWVGFRDTPWQLPLGAIRGYADPPGTTLGFVDAFPWFAVVMRLLAEWVPAVATWIGPAGQITGLWLILSLMLQGAIAAWIFHRLSPGNWPLLAGGTLIITLAPAWWHRMQWGHPALCGHWLILGALALALRSRKIDGPVGPGFFGTARAASQWLALQALASGLHPYIAAMTCAIGIASVHDRSKLRHSVTAAGMLVAVTGFVFWLFGYFSVNAVGSDKGGGGFHFFGADVLAFVNPMGSSALLPRFLRGWNKAGSYEGYAWVGAGALTAAVIVFTIRYLSPRKRKIKWAWSPPVMTALVLMALFSLGSNVRIGGFWVIDLEKPYALIDPLITTFRSAGRFIWPLYYAVLIQLMVLGSAIMQQKKFSRFEQGLVFALVTSLNVFDNSFFAREWFSTHGTDPVYARLAEIGAREVEIAALLPGARRANLVPAYLGSFSCRGIEAGKFRADDFVLWRAFGMWAARHRLASNSGAFARHDIGKLKAICATQMDDLMAGKLDPETVYVMPLESGRGAAENGAAIAAKSTCVTSGSAGAGFQFCRPG
ncbi:hypothetical protein EBZ80_10105 [bacterium]|nr:hypothetical protein [bacterium]